MDSIWKDIVKQFPGKQLLFVGSYLPTEWNPSTGLFPRKLITHIHTHNFPVTLVTLPYAIITESRQEEKFAAGTVIIMLIARVVSPRKLCHCVTNSAQYSRNYTGS